MKTITEWQKHVHRVAREKGWWPGTEPWELPDPVETGAKLMLIVSEVAEACEELRDDPESLNDIVVGPDGKPRGFAVELADAVIRIMDLATTLDIDLQRAMEVKSAYNETRPHRHGGKAL